MDFSFFEQLFQEHVSEGRIGLDHVNSSELGLYELKKTQTCQFAYSGMPVSILHLALGSQGYQPTKTVK